MDFLKIDFLKRIFELDDVWQQKLILLTCVCSDDGDDHPANGLPEMSADSKLLNKD